MSAYVLFRLPDGGFAKAPPGSVIGRLSSATVRIDDPRVSEAHALVSLRGSNLKLLTLRGSLRINGVKQSDVLLETGQRIQLARGVEIQVVLVELPSSVLALSYEASDQSSGLVHLVRSVYSITDQPQLEVVPRFVQSAAAHVWNATDGWRIRIQGEASEKISAGDRWQFDHSGIEAVSIDLPEAGIIETVVSDRLYTNLQILDREGTVHIHHEGQPSLVVNGKPAQIISELISMSALAPWYVVAGELWPNAEDEFVLRRNWDQTLIRLRRKLRDGGVRDNLVHADGTGNVELFLLPGDLVETV